MKTYTLAQLPSPDSPATAPPGGGGLLGSPMLFVGAMLLLMYALMIRPQQKKEKEHKTMLNAIERGDNIVSSGGIHGKVTGVTDDVLTVQIANNVSIKLSKSAVGSRVAKNAGDKT